MEYRIKIVRSLGSIEDEKILMQLYAIVHCLAENHPKKAGGLRCEMISRIYGFLLTMMPENVQRVYDYTYRLFLKDSGQRGSLESGRGEA